MMHSILSNRRVSLLAFVGAVALLGRRASSSSRSTFDAQPELEDAFDVCATHDDPVVAEFCRVDRPHNARRRTKVAEAWRRRDRCVWHDRGAAGPLQSQTELAADGLHRFRRNATPWSLQTAHHRVLDASVDTSRGGFRDHFSGGQRLQHCEVAGADDARWTFETFGPFASTGGYEWLSFGWPDAGRFGAHLAEDAAVWVTAYMFAPTDATGARPLGHPPIHIHHMHVSSSQSAARFYMDQALGFRVVSRPNAQGQIGIEFDLHGDRQCAERAGGTDCLLRAFPDGFGMRFTEPVETIADLNDARPADAPVLLSRVLYAYEWTRRARRAVGRFTTPTQGPWVFGHDNFLLRFGLRTAREYVAWSDYTAGVNCTVVHQFWHTHHQFTRDAWVLSGATADVGLDAPPFARRDERPEPYAPAALEVSAFGWTLERASDALLERIGAAQAACARRACAAPAPVVRCRLGLSPDRFESTAIGAVDRYVAPRCAAFRLSTDRPFSIVSFHRPMFASTPRESVWMHVLWYGLYVGDDDATVPRSMINAPTDFRELPARASPGRASGAAAELPGA